MQPFTIVRGVAAPMPIHNIDTDAITPSAAGRSAASDLGAMLFNNSRYQPDGSENPDFVLNQLKYRHSQILVAGRNFGCGSSRERAVWALQKFGIRCVIAPSFADIFYSNSLQNGLLPVILPLPEWQSLLDSLATSDAIVTVDLLECRITAPSGRYGFSVSPERRLALLEGLDEVDLMLRFDSDIEAFERVDRTRRPWLYDFAVGD